MVKTLELNGIKYGISKAYPLFDVALVKFGRGYWPERGMQILEVEDDFVGGFYLDRDQKEVDINEPEEEGFIYQNAGQHYDSEQKKYVPYKYKWDGKSFIKTRTYETKMIKFVKGKIENPVIKKK